eukprot:c20039_g2_i2.p1 GENE.c20039_g2_i2~~c20039_g2_i2.p1  ORF type:complete len:1349 (+),score=345.28 c20039_g2_i2:62-4048(+)
MFAMISLWLDSETKFSAPSESNTNQSIHKLAGNLWIELEHPSTVRLARQLVQENPFGRILWTDPDTCQYRRSSLFTFVDETVSPESVRAFLTQVWGIPPTNSMIAITGDAQVGKGPTESLSPFDQKLPKYLNDLIDSASARGAIVVSGGTNAGVVQTLGTQARGKDSHVLLGIATMGKIVGHEQLKAKCTKFPGSEVHYSQSEYDQAVLAPEKRMTWLEPNHSHFLLFEGDVWGDEIDFRNRFEALFSNNVLIVVGGGIRSFGIALLKIREGSKIVCLKGSGRAADVILEALEQREDQEIVREMLRNLSKKPKAPNEVLTPDQIRRDEAELKATTDRLHQQVREIVAIHQATIRAHGKGGQVKSVDLTNPSAVAQTLGIDSQPVAPIKHRRSTRVITRQPCKRWIHWNCECKKTHGRPRIFMSRSMQTLHSNSPVYRPKSLELVTDLSLVGVGLTDSQLRALSLGLMRNTVVKYLDLSDNCFGPQGMKWLAVALACNVTISQLNLQHNKISERNLLGESEIRRLDAIVLYTRHVSCDFCLEKLSIGVEHQQRLIPAFQKFANDYNLPRYEFNLEPGAQESEPACPEFIPHQLVSKPRQLQEFLELLEKQVGDNPDRNLDDDQDEAARSTRLPKMEIWQEIKLVWRGPRTRANVRSASLDATDFNGQSALHFAVDGGHVESAQLLLGHSANPDSRDKHMCRPRDLALEFKAKTEEELIEQSKSLSHNVSALTNVQTRLQMCLTFVDFFREHEGVGILERRRWWFAFRKSLQDIFFHGVFLTLVIICALNLTVVELDESQLFFMRQGLQGAVSNDPPFNLFSGIGLSEVGTTGQFESWLQGSLLAVIYSSPPRFVLNTNRLLGGVRLRQVRVLAESCSAPDRLGPVSDQDLADVCFPGFESGRLSKEPIPFLGGDSEIQQAFLYRPASDLGGTHVRGHRTDYPPGGYAIDLPLDNQTRGDEIVQTLINNKWIDSATRAVVVELSLYNFNVNRALSGIVLAETLATGQVVISTEFCPFQLDPHHEATFLGSNGFIAEIFLIIVVSIRSALLLINLVGRYKYNPAHKRWGKILRYIYESMLHVIGISVFIAIAVNRGLMWNEFHKLTPELLANDKHFVNLQRIASVYTSELALWSTVTTLYCLKTLGIFTNFPTIGPSIQAVLTTTVDRRVLVFTFSFVIVLVSFALGFFVLFSNYIGDFQTFRTSILAVLRIVFGEFSIDGNNFAEAQVEISSFHGGPFLFVALILFATLVMLNVFIALISTVYEEALAKSKIVWENTMMEAQSQQRTANLLLRILDMHVTNVGHLTQQHYTRRWNEVIPDFQDWRTRNKR